MNFEPVFCTESGRAHTYTVMLNPEIIKEDGAWIRVARELVEDDRFEAKKPMLDAYPNIRGMYNENDGNTQVFYMQNATATISSFGGAPIVIEF